MNAYVPANNLIAGPIQAPLGTSFAPKVCMRLLPLLLILVVPAVANARIGETALQFVDRYGPPKDSSSTKQTDKSSPLVEGAIHHTYEYQGWKIRAAFLELQGPAVRMEFQKLSGGPTGTIIRDDELQAIASANTPAGMTWHRMVPGNPSSTNEGLNKVSEIIFSNALGEKVWQRSDGAILWKRFQHIVRLELPSAGERDEQPRGAKEQKARASVPQF